MKTVLLTLLIAITTVSYAQNATGTSAQSSQTDKSRIVYENIMNRRSIRMYKPDQVSKAQLDTLVKCAINAPSAGNGQSWQVRVIMSQELMAKIRKINPDFAYGAPNVIVIAKDKNSGISSADCGFLAQNILLMAEAMNLGTVVLGGMSGIPNNPKAKEIMAALDIPDTHEVIFAIAVGYKNEHPDARPRDAGKVRFIN
jgi:nitroreductase